MRIALEIFFFLLFVLANASKCPETRKPHVTSCVIFYNCINLPDGGYVWAPAKCADGLVFQPSLRLCVLPSDTWMCNDSINHSSIDEHSLHTSEFIDKINTNDDEEITDDTVHPVDISHKIDNIPNLGNVFMTIPYPLIEIDKELNVNEKQDINSHPSHNSVKRLGNELSHVNHEQEYIPVTLIKVKDKENDKIINLKSFFNRIFLYQHIAPSVNQQTFVSSPFIDYSTMINNEHIGNNLLNYFIENYFFKKISDDLKPMNKTEILIQVKTTTEKIKTNQVQSNFISTTEKNLNNLDNIDELNSILAVTGNLGRKEYITVEKYKSSINQVNIKILDIIPCMRGHRLPNSTDCTRYYTCDPTSAEIHEFICPSNTAFNNQINLCDTQKYKLCKGNRNFMLSEKITSAMKLHETVLNNKYKNENDNPSEMKLCETTGKFADVTSNKFYYLCYLSNNSGKIESFRMSCPNNLIFCQDKNVCTIKGFCSNFD